MDKISGLKSGEELEAEVSGLKRGKGVFLDIDFFREFKNDHSYLLKEGNLKEMGAYFKKLEESFNISAYRTGGDEFLLLQGETASVDMGELANKVVKDIEGLGLRNSLPGNEHKVVTVSAVVFPVRFESAGEFYEYTGVLEDLLHFVKKRTRGYSVVVNTR